MALYDETDFENERYTRKELLRMGAEEFPDKMFCGYLKLKTTEETYIFEPDDVKNLDKCKYTCRRIL